MNNKIVPVPYAHNNPAKARTDAKKIAKKTAEFLARGGKIETVAAFDEREYSPATLNPITHKDQKEYAVARERGLKNMKRETVDV